MNNIIFDNLTIYIIISMASLIGLCLSVFKLACKMDKENKQVTENKDALYDGCNNQY